MKEARWWHVYGLFREGLDGLPHFGELIKHYRVLRGHSVEKLAELYGCQVRWIYQLESESNMDAPRTPGRRRALAGVLGIPLVLFGLEPVQATQTQLKDTTHDMLLEDLLLSSWQIYYNGSFTQSTRNIAIWLYQIEHSVQMASGTDKARLQALWCGFLQLSAASLRDQDAGIAAIRESNKAVALARELGDANLLSTSLYQNFRNYEQDEDYKNAYTAAIEGIRIAEKAGIDVSVLGNLYVAAGEVTTNLAKTDPIRRKEARSWFYKADRLARTTGDIATGSYLKFGLQKVLINQALALAVSGGHKDAEDRLAVARSLRGSMRWTLDLALAEADILSAAGGDTTQALSLIKDTRAQQLETGSSAHTFWTRRILQDITTRQPNNTEAQRLLLSL